MTPLFMMLLVILAQAAAGVICLLLAPSEATMGDLQQIFYLHAPAAWTSLCAFAALCVAAAADIARPSPVRAALARSLGEVGLLFGVAAVATGGIWAKTAWRTPWVWEPKLASALFVLFIYAGHACLRASGQRRVADVYAVAALPSVPLCYLSTRLAFEGLHPAEGLAFSLEGLMLAGTLTAFAADLLFAGWLVHVAARIYARADLEGEE